MSHLAIAQTRWAGNDRGRCGLSHRALHQALSFIESNLGRRIGLEDISRAACVSRFHFARQFRVSTGRSPMEYLLRTRIERAKQLLRDGELPAGSIALELGFCDQSHFTRHFRRLVGTTPRQFGRLDPVVDGEVFALDHSVDGRPIAGHGPGIDHGRGRLGGAVPAAPITT